MFSINANVMYSIDEKGQHSLEISYSDSDGADVGVYSKGDSFEKVVLDAADQMDEAMAAYDDDKADVEEAATIDKALFHILPFFLQRYSFFLKKQTFPNYFRKNSICF